MFNPNEKLIELKGKDYLQVMWRLVWFREDKPLWGINTEVVKLDDKQAVFKAYINDESGNLKSAGTGSETISDFKDYIEKAETKAVGRALAMLGYGTQFAPELDEGERIVDSPVANQKPKKEPQPAPKPPAPPKTAKEELSELYKRFKESTQPEDCDRLNFIKDMGKEFGKASIVALSEEEAARILVKLV